MENTQSDALHVNAPGHQAGEKERKEHFWVNLTPVAQEKLPGLDPHQTPAPEPWHAGNTVPLPKTDSTAPRGASGAAVGPADTDIQQMPLYGPGSQMNMTDSDRIVYEMQSSRTDPQGSWTGRPEEPYEKPVQDADDL